MPPRTKQPKKSESLKQGRILIICEGKQTESNYFKKFREKLQTLEKHRVVDIVVEVDTAKHPAAKRVFEDALRKKDSTTPRYSEVWCVFDKDRNTDSDYNHLISKRAKEENIYIAYSNPCFELWFLLHFDYLSSKISGVMCETKLNNRMQGYSKTDSELFNKLENKQSTAIKHAKKLAEMWKENTDFANQNPSTTVHELVEMLNNYLEKVQNAAK